MSTKNEPPSADGLDGPDSLDSLDGIDGIDEVQATAEELAEAAELARAIERGTASRALGQDALEAVALLRATRRPTLDPARQTAIFEALQPALDKQRQRGRARGRGAWLWWVGTAFGAAALLLIVQRNDPALEPSAARTGASDEKAASARGREIRALPAPGSALLEAQAALLSEGNAEQQRRFEHEMSRYRDRVLASLEER